MENEFENLKVYLESLKDLKEEMVEESAKYSSEVLSNDSYSIASLRQEYNKGINKLSSIIETLENQIEIMETNASKWE